MSTTGTAPADSGTRLRPPRHPVDPRAVGWWTANLLLLVVPPVAVLVLLGALIAPARFWLLLPAGVLAVVGAAAVATLPRWWFRVHRWEVTDTAVYTQTGWWSRERRIAPMSRIQTVDLAEGPLERVFRLATVTVTTASAAGALRISGLDRTVARDLVDELTRQADAVEGDAT